MSSSIPRRRRDLLIFSLVVTAGFVAWAWTPSFPATYDLLGPERLPGMGPDLRPEELPPLVALLAALSALLVVFVDGGMPLAALVAAAAGFASPGYFWAWGVAANLLRPFAGVLLPFYMDLRFEDYREFAGPPTEFLGQRVLLETLSFVAFCCACTVAAALGAGLGLLRRRAGGSRPGERL